MPLVQLTPPSSVVENYLTNSLQPMRELEDVLDPMIHKISDRRLDRATKAVLAVKKRMEPEEIVEKQSDPMHLQSTCLSQGDLHLTS